MPLESATYIHELNPNNPVGASDSKSQGDDHLRMVKAALQATFSGITGEVTVTHTQLNAVGASGITGFAAPTNDVGSAAQSGGVATTAMRSDATLQVNLNAAYTWSGQHSFLAASSALTGTLDARSSTPGMMLYETDAAANNKAWLRYVSAERFRESVWNDAGNVEAVWLAVERTGTVVDSIALTATALTFNGSAVPTADSAPTWTDRHTFTDADYPIILSSIFPSITLNQTDGAVDNRRWDVIATTEQFKARAVNDAVNAATNWLQVDRAGTTISSVNFPNGTLQYGGTEVGYKTVPRRISGFAGGECLAVSSGVTLNTSDMATSRCFSIYNDSASAITLTQGAGVTLRLGGTATTGNRTIAPRGMCTVWCNSATEAIATGHVS